MIRRLRIKFVCVVMAIVTVMLAGIFGVILYFTSANMHTQSISMMHAIAANPFQLGYPDRPSEEVRLPYFTVQINKWGDMMATGGGYFDLSDQEALQQLVSQVMAAESEQGELKDYGLRYLISNSPVGFVIVFADTSTEAATLRNLFYSCLLIFLAAMLVFLGISVLLSHWAIRPVERAWNQPSHMWS